MLKFKFTLLILVLAATSFASVDSVPIGVRFTHEDSGAGQVFLAGAFNEWSSTANPMTDNDGTWTIIMALKAGFNDLFTGLHGAGRGHYDRIGNANGLQVISQSLQCIRPLNIFRG